VKKNKDRLRIDWKEATKPEAAGPEDKGTERGKRTRAAFGQGNRRKAVVQSGRAKGAPNSEAAEVRSENPWTARRRVQHDRRMFLDGLARQEARVHPAETKAGGMHMKFHRVAGSALAFLLFLLSSSFFPRGASATGEPATETKLPEELTFNQEPPGPLDLMKKYVKVGLSGTLQLDVLHDFQAVGWPAGSAFLTEFVTGNIPVRGTAPALMTNRTDFSVNQSNVVPYIEAPTAWGTFRVLAKINLMGEAAGGPSLNFYYGYAQLGPFMAGQYYSTLFTYDASPNTLDFEGPNAVPMQVHPMLRMTPTLVGDLALVFALELPDADMTLPGGVSALDQVPDVIAGLQYQPQWATIRLVGLYRRLKAKGIETGGTLFDDSANGWGVCLSGNIEPLGKDSLQFGGIGGQGIGNYIQDTIGLGMDAAQPYPGATTILPITAWGAWIGYQHFWRFNLTSTATYAYVDLSPMTGQQPGAGIPTVEGVYQNATYASFNLIWSPLAPFNMGMEYLYGERNATTGYGNDHRLMWSVAYNFGF
jgi:hypothetical protein